METWLLFIYAKQVVHAQHSLPNYAFNFHYDPVNRILLVHFTNEEKKHAQRN